MLYCFLDTNIFQEFQPIKDIKWLEELNVPEVCLVVTSVVVSELDKHKTGSSNRLRKRARRSITFLKTLDRQADNEICPDVTLRFDLFEPKRHTLDEHNLSAQVKDDLLVAKALEFRNSHQTDQVAIVTNDAVVQFKAEGYGLSVPELSENYRLPHEVDPIEKENQELKNQLMKLQQSRPNLRIGFESDNDELVDFSHAAVSLSTEYISELEVKSCVDSKRCDVMNNSNIDQGLFTLPDSIGREMTRTDIYQYRDYVDSWLKHKYALYLRARSFHDVFHKRSVTVALTLQNTGLGTAEGLNIKLNIPSPWSLELESPDEPAYPGEPASQSQWRLTQDSIYLESDIDHSELDFEMTNPANPIITRTIELDEPELKTITFSISRIRPDESLKIKPLYLFPENSECLTENFTIEYEILKDNPGPKQSEKLRVTVNHVDP